MNYAKQYQQALAQAFPKVLHFGDLWNTPNKSIFKVDEAHANTVYLPVLATTGRVNGSRGSVKTPAQRHSNDWEAKVLSNHRIWDTLVHPQDINQTNMVLTLQNITKTFNETQKFKEMDCYLASKIYSDWASLSGKSADSSALTASNILKYIDEVMQAMDEAEVPEEGRILYVTPAYNTLIKNAIELQRYLAATDKEVSRTIKRIDDLIIKRVPSNRMKTAYNFTEGAVPGASAKQIDMMFVHPLSVLPVTQYSQALLDSPSALTNGQYYYFEEAFEDVFILNQRADAIAFHVTAPTQTETKNPDETE